jgi:hypothetical protein
LFLDEDVSDYVGVGTRPTPTTPPTKKKKKCKAKNLLFFSAKSRASTTLIINGMQIANELTQ